MGPGGRASGKRYVIKFKHNKFRFVVDDDDDDDSKHILVESASSDFATGDWVHVTAVRDMAAKAVHLYCNGQLKNTTVDTAGDISSPGEPLFIGAKQKENTHAANPANTPVDSYFKGMLDDLRIYDYVLSQAEIANIMGLSSIQVLPPSAESLFDVARQYEQAEIYTQAKSIYQQIVGQNPNSPEANKAKLDIPKTQILLLFESGQNEAAQAAIDKLIADFSQNPYLPEMLYGVAKEYQDSDEFERAINIYQKIATHCSSSDYAIMARTNIILSYILMNRISDSKQALNQLIEEFQGHSDFPKAIYEVAEPYKEAGEQELAEDFYKTIITKYPVTDHALKSLKKLIVLYIETGKDNKAQQSLNVLVEKFSGHTDLASVLEYIAGKYKMANKSRQAKNIYQKIAAGYPGTNYAIQAQKNFAIANMEEGNDVTVQRVLDKLIVDFSDRPLTAEVIFAVGENYYLKAKEYEEQNLVDEAKENFRKAITVWNKLIIQFPNSEDTPDACNYSADCYNRLGEYQESINSYKKVVDDYPDCPHTWQALRMIGQNYENLKHLGRLPTSEADLKIKAAYEQLLLQNYPRCSEPEAEYIKGWIKQYNALNVDEGESK